MKKKILMALLFLVCICLSGCNKKMTEDEIKKALEVNDENRTFTVNKVTYATDKFTINGINMEANGEKVILGGSSFESRGDNYKQITGYFDQPSDTYVVYVLSDNNIWKIQNESQDLFENPSFESKNIINATDLILVECNETTAEFGETPLKYQVYALVNNKLKLIEE